MPRRLLPLLLLLLSLVVLTACSVFNRRQFGNEVVLEGSGVVTCSGECAARGQCGESVDRGTFVFAGVDTPRVADHNGLLPVDTAVTILETRSVNLQSVSDTTQQFPLNFYNVILEDQTRSGWVAGWCIADQ